MCLSSSTKNNLSHTHANLFCNKCMVNFKYLQQHCLSFCGPFLNGQVNLTQKIVLNHNSQHSTTNDCHEQLG